MRMFLTLVIVALLGLSNFTSAYGGSGETRTKIAKELTGKYRGKGFPVAFEATGKDKNIIKITQKNITQDPLLTEGQLITLLGTYLKDGIQSRLKKTGFISGEFVDGKSRKYPFEL
ncbi:hypothetical protein [Pelobacter propionicus]|uniref:Uncharacterized protein n=1 Tax=Pelobacter propionicus (strain DSM 2379 / NBRC 103807 / OttBd1) TaxID=338966 RepID=A1APB5_PELPD|nr:hypothetical protein [Pelobacter propionicus]ABK99185.1 hypothetical protein Ppro_1570 [Pelobacter propionicus DSM 2379]